MLEGKRIHLRLAEKEDAPLLAHWLNDVEFAVDFQHFPDQLSKVELERRILEHKLYQTEWIDFIIEKKDGTKSDGLATTSALQILDGQKSVTQSSKVKETKVMEQKL
jgi:RimJ/RimL family protein N-acetyltransferase